MSKPFRIPLVGPYNSRVGAPSTASGIVGIGVVGVMIVGGTARNTDKDARYVNCYGQKISDTFTGRERIYTVKRPGFGTHTTPASGEKGQAVLLWTGQGSGDKVISAFGATNSTVYDGTTSLGAITGRCTGLTETVISTTPTLAVTSSDHTAWYYDTGVGVMTRITDGDFPGNASLELAGTFAHMDGFACVMTTSASLYAGDLNSMTAWTANSFGAHNAYPDRGVGCVRHRNFIMAFGTESVEFWYNAGLTPFPLARANASTLKIGAVSAGAIAQISDTTFWCGSTPQGGMSIFQYDGSVSRISTPEIDSTLILSGAANISLTTIRFYGRSFVVVRAGSLTLVYCIEEKFWHEWTTASAPLWYKCAGLSTTANPMSNYAVSNVSTSGKVYVMNPASLVFTDDGSTYTARIQLPTLDLGTRRTKFWHDVEIVGDRETSASAVSLLYTDDDYQNYTTHGSGDLANDRVRFTRLGSSRRRGWVLTHAANTPMRLEALEGNVTIGNS
jgi:hypothetical protein